MALWTQQDLEDARDAYKAAVVNGIFSCTIAGQACTGFTAEAYEKLIDRIQADLNKEAIGGGTLIRPFAMVKTIPPAAG